ncbi:MAG: citrate synthase [Oscillospiraceae bacterium]|nr:citrate synthase [Oscillospiraceae bacterium]
MQDYLLQQLCGILRDEYSIGEENFRSSDIKRGLRNADGTGVLAGVTRIGDVQGYRMENGVRMPAEGHLYYRGIDLNDIIDAHVNENTFGFEEVSYLLLMGRLPYAMEYDLYNEALSRARQLPSDFFQDKILKAPTSDIMNGLARSVLALYSYDKKPDDTSLENIMRQSIELIGRFPTIVANTYAVKRHIFDGRSLYIHNPKEELSVSENFLRMLRKDKNYTDREAKLLDIMMIIHAEHGGGNNSAFVCRALSSSGTDTYSAIAGAVGALKGPLHGGANAKVLQMFKNIKDNVSDTDSDEKLTEHLRKIVSGKANDGSGKIYGLGHAVYTLSDPRAVLIKKYAGELAQETGNADDFELMMRIEKLGKQVLCEAKGEDMTICANVDMYSGLVYSMLGIPEELFTPLFAIARIAGWCAHRLEEVMTGGRIMRPAYRAAVNHGDYIPATRRHISPYTGSKK